MAVSAYHGSFNFFLKTGENTMASTLQALKRWIDNVAALTRPAKIRWGDGPKAEYQALVQHSTAASRGTLIVSIENPQG